jgi:hypothetical protein
MARIDMNALAKLGAHARINELEEELKQLRAFVKEHHLEGKGEFLPDHDPTISRTRSGFVKSLKERRRVRHKMTNEQREAVSLRMKKYWAAKRREK